MDVQLFLEVRDAVTRDLLQPGARFPVRFAVGFCECLHQVNTQTRLLVVLALDQTYRAVDTRDVAAR